MDLSFKEKVAFARLLTALAMIDDEFHPKEKNFLIEELNTDEIFLLESLTAPIDSALSFIKTLDKNKKTYFLDVIHNLIKADGICKIKETEFALSVLHSLELLETLSSLHNPLYSLLKKAMQVYKLNYSNINF